MEPFRQQIKVTQARFTLPNQAYGLHQAAVVDIWTG